MLLLQRESKILDHLVPLLYDKNTEHIESQSADIFGAIQHICFKSEIVNSCL